MHTSLLRWCMLVMRLPAAWGAAGDAGDAGLNRYAESLAKPVADAQAAIAKASATATAEKDASANRTAASLAAAAKAEVRAGRTGSAAATWREVLRLDRSHAEARGFFTAIGTIDAELAKLDAPPAADAVDLLGNPIVPAPAGPAAELPPSAVAALDKHQQAVAAANTKQQKALDAAQALFVRSEQTARERAVRDIAGMAATAQRQGDLAAVAGCWQAVLSLDRDHADARAFFTSLGRLDAVLAELGEAQTAAQQFAGLAQGSSVGLWSRRRLGHAAICSKAWLVPYGGTVALGEEIVISGPGKGDAQGATAIIPCDAGKVWTLRGEVWRSGRWSGFTLGSDAEGTTFCSYFTSQGRGLLLHSHTGAQRRGVQGANGGLVWPVESWQPFTLACRNGTVQLTLPGGSQTCTLPEDRRGAYLGVHTYLEAVMKLRKLELLIGVAEIAEAPKMPEPPVAAKPDKR